MVLSSSILIFCEKYTCISCKLFLINKREIGAWAGSHLSGWREVQSPFLLYLWRPIGDKTLLERIVLEGLGVNASADVFLNTPLIFSLSHYLNLLMWCLFSLDRQNLCITMLIVWLSWSIRTSANFYVPFWWRLFKFACPLKSALWLNSESKCLVSHTASPERVLIWGAFYILLHCPTLIKITTVDKFNVLYLNILNQKSVNHDCNCIRCCHNFMKWVILCQESRGIF